MKLFGLISNKISFGKWGGRVGGGGRKGGGRKGGAMDTGNLN